MTSELPPKPDFAAIDSSAHDTANRRNSIAALIGNLVFSWSNNESMFIYVLMLLLNTDEKSAAIVFATLNTTRARLDLIRRLAQMHVRDREIHASLDKLLNEFDRCTRVRNQFNHCMYSFNERGEITATRSLRVEEKRGGLQFGRARAMNDARLREMADTIAALTQLNRDIWDFLPRLRAHLNQDHLS